MLRKLAHGVSYYYRIFAATREVFEPKKQMGKFIGTDIYEPGYTTESVIKEHSISIPLVEKIQDVIAEETAIKEEFKDLETNEEKEKTDADALPFSDKMKSQIDEISEENNISEIELMMENLVEAYWESQPREKLGMNKQDQLDALRKKVGAEFEKFAASINLRLLF